MRLTTASLNRLHSFDDSVAQDVSQFFDFFLPEFTMFPLLKSCEVQKADLCAHKSQCGMSDCSSHFPDLSIFPFAEGQFDPECWNVLSKAYGNGPLRQHRLAVKKCDLSRHRLLSAQDDSFSDHLQFRLNGFIFYLGEICPGVSEFWVSKSVLYEIVIGEKDQSFAIRI